MTWWPFARNDLNTKNLTTVPIIFVPGLMGSRLQLQGMTWDPDAGPSFYMQWNWYHLETKRTALNHKNPCTVMDLTKDNGIPCVASAFYGKFLKALAKKKFPAAKTPVYAVGYDWRKSNEDSATAVKDRIAEILEAEKANRFVLISHSMGGLVSRAMFKQYEEIAAKATGVIHVAQPAAGAVVLYRRLFTGMQPELDGSDAVSKILNNAFGKTPAETAALYAVMPGPMQLLCTNHYHYNDDVWHVRHWWARRDQD
mgnify:CR=1 FL=1